MSLLLSGMYAQSKPRSTKVGFNSADAAELAHADQQASLSFMAIDEASSKIEELLSRALLTSSIDTDNKDLVKRDCLEMRNALSSLGMTPEATESLRFGFESAKSSAELGNEAWQTIKKVVADAIKWVVEQLENAKNWIMKVFNKYFGAFESQKANWEKLSGKAEEAANEGKVLDGKEKFETKRAAEFYSKDNKVGSPTEFSKDIEKFSTDLRVRMLGKDKTVPGSTPDFKIPESKDIISGDALVDKATLIKLLPINWVAKSSKSRSTVRPEYLPEGATMFGEVCEFTYAVAESDITDAESLLNAYKAIKSTILPANPKAKPKLEAKVEFATTSEVVAMATAYSDAMSLAMDIVRGNTMKVLTKSLDQASKDLNSWAKDAPDESATFAGKTAYRAGVSLVTAWLNLNRRLGIETVNANAKYMLSCSQAHYALATASIKAHSKPTV